MSTDPRIHDIASICHEANRAFCATHGDVSHKTWWEAPQWQRTSSILGVSKIAAGEVTRPEQSHESWAAQKVAEGWVYGPTKDEVAKTHPCLVPFTALPPHQQMKDVLFLSMAIALLFGAYPTAAVVSGESVRVAGSVELSGDGASATGVHVTPGDVIPVGGIADLHRIADSLQHRDHALASQIRGIIAPQPPLDPPAPFNAPSPS